jgi:GMP synthase - Glutamine amidotransferase domain
VYCEIIPYSYTINQIKAKNPKALIFSGGPNSVYAENTPSIDDGVFSLGIPILGLCYGHQLMAKKLGGVVAHAGSAGEYGKTAVSLDNETRLNSGIEKNNNLLDEPSGLCRNRTGRLCYGRPYGRMPCCGHDDRGKTLLRRSVTSGSQCIHPLDRTCSTTYLYDICGLSG